MGISYSPTDTVDVIIFGGKDIRNYLRLGSFALFETIALRGLI
jgi:hypothetical protein